MFEIEIKSLLTSEQEFLETKARLEAFFPNFSFSARESQLNHYFNVDGNLALLLEKIWSLLGEQKFLELQAIIELRPENYSLRTRSINQETLKLVLKLSGETGTSANGSLRREFEAVVPLEITQLDQILLDCGFTYLSKWSRNREEYNLDADTKACFDQNAGYGWILEIEKIATSQEQAKVAKAEIIQIMDKVGLKALDEERLERMFTFYNQNWPEYYGSEKIFVIE